MSYYKHHIYFCLNERKSGAESCVISGSIELFDYMKLKVKEANLEDGYKIRVNKAGCLGRCSEGPVIVIYPEAIWYQCKTTNDIDEVIEQHLQKKQIVQNLKLSDIFIKKEK